MKVQELLVSIRNKEFDLEKRLEVKKYLPIELKKTIAQGIIFDCTDASEGAIKVDSVQQYMSYIEYMIKYHTNLEYTDEDYDVLCSTEYGESTLLNEIVRTFQADANECNRILDMMIADYIANNDIEIQIAMFLNKLSGNLNGITEALEGAINKVDLKKMIPKDIDMDVVSEFLKNYK